MALRWSGWTDSTITSLGGSDARSPYVDWQRTIDPRRTEARFAFVPQRLPLPGADGMDSGQPEIVLPRRALPHDATVIAAPPECADVLAGLTVPPDEDAVIVGVIDAGLALAHERFRRAEGKGTRILSCWRQGGRWEGQPHLPFGRELTQRDMDRMLDAAQGDEGAFNRMAGMVDFADPDGDRWVETRAPHGTAVADLAAGCDPLSDDLARLRDRAHLVMVELAPRPSIGSSGDFLEFYAIWAIRHIVDTADAIWRARFAGQARRGFPIVINLSYGRHAGPKDGSALIQRFLRALTASRPPEAPVRFVLPAGNDNLDRGSAVLGHRDPGETHALCWRILPEDRTASYAEIWADPPKAKGRGDSHPGPLSLSPPSGPALDFGADLPRPGQCCDLIETESGRPVARVYCCRSFDPEAATPTAIGYVLCVAPTWQASPPPAGWPAAPAGAWRITLGAGPLAKLHVQSDQTFRPGPGSAQLSYFEDLADTPPHLRYRSHDDTGALRDSYGLHPVTAAVIDNEPAGKTGPIRRQNTLNALAASAGSLTIAGYRDSDGWPAAYSGTGRGFAIGTASGGASVGLAGMDAACISEDGPWRGGRLAAAGRSGAVAALGGTSFASAEAARLITLALLAWIDDGCRTQPPGDAAWLRALAARSDAARVAAALGAGVVCPPAQALDRKLGWGRLPRQDHGRPTR